jgi:hypothetical protein
MLTILRLSYYSHFSMIVRLSREGSRPSFYNFQSKATAYDFLLVGAKDTVKDLRVESARNEVHGVPKQHRHRRSGDVM